MLKDVLIGNNPYEYIRNNKDEIYKIIPELKVCDGFDQHNDYHIYDVLEHILHVLDYVENNYLLRIAALFHDIGKPECFILDDEGIGHFYGHWNKSIEIFNKYIDLFDLSDSDVKLIIDLIYYHDLSMTRDNIPLFESIFNDKLNLLISLKKADILAQNSKYSDRVVELEKLLYEASNSVF